jgi:hypothetical protein
MVCPPGQRIAKLDNHYNRGIFLGYTSTLSHIYSYDLDTNPVQIALSMKFDKAGIALSSLTPNMR